MDIPNFFWQLFSTFLGIPLGVLLAHWLSRSQRKYDLKFDALKQILHDLYPVANEEPKSLVNLHRSMQDALLVFSSEKEIALSIRSFLKETEASRNLDKVSMIINLMSKDLGLKLIYINQPSTIT